MDKRILNEPLVHFLLIGMLIFLGYSLLDKEDVDLGENELIVTQGEVDHIKTRYAQSWGATPNDELLKSLIDEYVITQIKFKESLKLNLDHNDEIVKRRLSQKFDFLMQDLAELEEPTNDELKNYFENNKSLFTKRAEFTFRHRYFDSDQRENNKEYAIEKLALIESQRMDFEEIKSDEFHLPLVYERASFFQVSRDMGSFFADSLWQEPSKGVIKLLESGYGFHLVKVVEIHNIKTPKFENLKDEIRMNYLSDKQKVLNDNFLKSLLSKYQVIHKHELRSSFK